MLIKDSNDPTGFSSQARDMIEAVALAYNFPKEGLCIEPLTEQDYRDYGFPEEEFEISVSTTEGGKFMKIECMGCPVKEIPLEEVFQQRRQNLIDETRVYSAADSDDKLIQSVAADCGYGTDIRQIIGQATAMGLTELIGTRSSCGAAEAIQRYDPFGELEEVDITTIGFKTSAGDRVEVLYLGRGTTDPIFVDMVARNIAKEEFEMKIVEPPSYSS
jgi:hypothetical protein